MHGLAAKSHQAGTAFLLKTPEIHRFGLRGMTPTREVPLCGHATLAAAHVVPSGGA
jgi:predicted PhzF superfamily epimerase YddE/YHI9